MLTRQSEDGQVFSIGDEEFGDWAAEDDDETYLPVNLEITDFSSTDGNKTPKGKHD